MMHPEPPQHQELIIQPGQTLPPVRWVRVTPEDEVNYSAPPPDLPTLRVTLLDNGAEETLTYNVFDFAAGHDVPVQPRGLGWRQAGEMGPKSTRFVRKAVR